MAPRRTQALPQLVVQYASPSLAINHGVQSSRSLTIIGELGRANSNIHAAAASYNGHLSYIQNQMQRLQDEHDQSLKQKDSTIAQLDWDLHQLKGANASLSNESTGKDATIAQMKYDVHKLKFASESSLTALIKDVRRHERQILSLLCTLEKERTDYKTKLNDLSAAHAKDLAIVNRNHVQQLVEVGVKRKEEITRVKMWREKNRPRPNELSRILERQRRSALQAEMGRVQEEAELRNLWNEARFQELEREKNEVEHQLAKVQRQ
ncbi:hypothetical protein G6011_06948 [Alternaria panax]|uniref:Uncharacterized protein n=1 Tax=Alternaria panax TaxID=48097 RepID=A0AAD4F8T2_9PLEO|nr:hypothetical protein G6011_06948 [Alternaria panax]